MGGREILGQHNLQRSVDTTIGKSTLYSSNVDQVFFIRKISPLIGAGIFEQHLVVERSDCEAYKCRLEYEEAYYHSLALYALPH